MLFMLPICAGGKTSLATGVERSKLNYSHVFESKAPKLAPTGTCPRFACGAFSWLCYYRVCICPAGQGKDPYLLQQLGKLSYDPDVGYALPFPSCLLRARFSELNSVLKCVPFLICVCVDAV